MSASILDNFDAYAAHLGYVTRRRDLFAREGWAAAAYEDGQGQSAVLLWAAASERRARLERAIKLLRRRMASHDDEGRTFVLPLEMALDDRWSVFRVDGAVACAGVWRKTRSAPTSREARAGWLDAASSFLSSLREEGLRLERLSSHDVLLFPDGRACVAFFDGVDRVGSEGRASPRSPARLLRSFAKELDLAPDASWVEHGGKVLAEYAPKAKEVARAGYTGVVVPGARALYHGTTGYVVPGLAGLYRGAKDYVLPGLYRGAKDYALPAVTGGAQGLYRGAKGLYDYAHGSEPAPKKGNPKGRISHYFKPAPPKLASPKPTGRISHYFKPAKKAAAEEAPKPKPATHPFFHQAPPKKANAQRDTVPFDPTLD